MGNNNYDYFIGYTNFSTDGRSAMRDNEEKDGYRSDSLTMNYGYDFSKQLGWKIICIIMIPS